MTRLFVTILLLIGAMGFFKDRDHKELTRNFINNFITDFKSDFEAVSLGGIDFMGAMELGFDYWITRIRIHNFDSISINFDTEFDIVEFSAPLLNIDLIIEDKYTIPIKIQEQLYNLYSFIMSLILETSPEYLRASQVELNYGSVSLDVNSVIEYFSRQLLSLDMLKNALKESELPLRNLFANAIRHNARERIIPLLEAIQSGNVNSRDLVNLLRNVRGTRIEGREYILLLKDMFGFASQRKQKEDL